jgi:peptidoglycan/xylan/chitin deacetylase (PgdA/CDA1 family)
MMLSWREIARLADDGVEIGSHSVTHPDFGTLDRASAQEELEGLSTPWRPRLGSGHRRSPYLSGARATGRARLKRLP